MRLDQKVGGAIVVALTACATALSGCTPSAEATEPAPQTAAADQTEVADAVTESSFRTEPEPVSLHLAPPLFVDPAAVAPAGASPHRASSLPATS